MQYEVLFEIPQQLQQGLVTGQFERIGGVIRDAKTKQIVSWLREGTTQQAGKFTFLGKGIGQGLLSISTLGMIVNMSLTTATIANVQKIEGQINEISQHLQLEADNRRDVKFHTALNAFEDMLNANNIETHKSRANQAIIKFEELTEEFLQLFYQTLEANVEKSIFYLQQAMLAASYRARSYAEINEIEIAQQRLKKDLLKFRETIDSLLKHLMGKYPAIFFHKDVSSENLRRFVDIYQEWNQTDLFAMIDSLRIDFWNSKLTKEGIFSRISRKNQSFREIIPDRISQMEVAVENFHRLESVDMEIRYLRLTEKSFREWNNIVSDQDLVKHDMALINLAEPISLEES